MLKKISLKEALIGFSFDLDYFNGKKFSINNEGDFIVRPGYKKYKILRYGKRKKCW